MNGSPMDTSPDILDCADIRLADVGRVGGKNASLGELFRTMKPRGVGVLDGFSTTADAYRRLLRVGGLEERLRSIFEALDPENLTELAQRGQAARTAVLDTPLSGELRRSILAAYERLSARLGREPDLAMRSSATAEDLPEASFAGAAESFIITNHIGIHPMALAHFANLKDARAIREIAARIGTEDAREFFIRRFSEGVARIAAAFYPKPVIIRMSDFKTNEYARLLGGQEFEPGEENPMIGFRSGRGAEEEWRAS
jgi:phosphoenolpyruvate synthase/pyruvate phosphate dikinase